MGWVSGAGLTAATAAAGGLGLIASATMDFGQLRTAIAQVKQRTTNPFGVNLRAGRRRHRRPHQAAGRRADQGGELRPGAEGSVDRPAARRRRPRRPVDRRQAPRGEGARVGRRRGARAGRGGRWPHRLRAHDDPPAAGRRRGAGARPGDRGGRLLRRPRPRRRARVRRRRHRHGHPVPAERRQRGAAVGEGVLPRSRGDGHGRHEADRRRPAPHARHRARGRGRIGTRQGVGAASCDRERVAVPQAVGHHAHRRWRRKAWPCASRSASRGPRR